MTQYSEDRFLGGRLTIRQPTEGFRAGLDTVMLAAAVTVKAGDKILELGAGCGTASLCLAARVSDCMISGAEIDPALVGLANENARTNGKGARVSFFACDVLSPELRGDFDHVFANPPFHRDDGQGSPNENRARSKHGEGNLAAWIEVGAKRTRTGGTFTAIVRADRLKEVLGALPDSGISIFPLWPHQSGSAKRAIVRLRKGSFAPLTMLPGLVLHEADGKYTARADAILRGLGGFDEF